MNFKHNADSPVTVTSNPNVQPRYKALTKRLVNAFRLGVSTRQSLCLAMLLIQLLSTFIVRLIRINQILLLHWHICLDPVSSNVSLSCQNRLPDSYSRGVWYVQLSPPKERTPFPLRPIPYNPGSTNATVAALLRCPTRTHLGQCHEQRHTSTHRNHKRRFVHTLSYKGEHTHEHTHTSGISTHIQTGWQLIK